MVGLKDTTEQKSLLLGSSSENCRASCATFRQAFDSQYLPADRSSSFIDVRLFANEAETSNAVTM